MAYSNTPSAVHLDVPLTNLTLAYATSQNFIADKVFPIVEVDKQSNKYYTFDADEMNRTGDVKLLAPRTAPPKFELSHSTDSYFSDVYGLAVDFDEQTLANEDTQLMTRSRKVNTAVHKMLLKREQDFVATFLVPSIWGTTVTGTTGTPSAGTTVKKWSDGASTPIQDIRSAKTAMKLRTYGFAPNTLILSQTVLDELMDHPDILDRINGGATKGAPADVDLELLARVFSVERVLLAAAAANTAAEGIAASRNWLWTNDALLVYTPSSAGLETPAAGLTFAWNSVPGVSYGISTESFTDDALRRSGIAEEVQVKMSYDMKLTGAGLGYYFDNVV